MPQERTIEALTHLHRYLGVEQPPKQAPPPLNIALSRQAGAGGTEVARAVGSRLDWPVYDQELVNRIAQEKGLKEQLLKSFDERYVSWVEEVVASLANETRPLDATYFNELMRLFKSLARAGHSVIVGRGAPHVLPQDTTLRVRLVAPRTDRVRRAQELLGVTADKAERWVDKQDHDRKAFVKFHFAVDADDPLGYDLLLNSGTFDIEECATIIVDAARVLESKTAKKVASQAASRR